MPPAKARRAHVARTVGKEIPLVLILLLVLFLSAQLRTRKIMRMRTDDPTLANHSF
jgi:hypothetical protein